MSDARHVLDADELATLRPYGTEERVAAGTVLFSAGDETYDFIVVLDGQAAIAEHGQQQRTVGSFGPGEFLGELDLLTGKRAALGAAMETDGRILRVPVARIRVVMAQEPGLSEMILRTFLARRANLMALGAGLTLIGSRADAPTRRLLETLSRNQLAASWLELDADPEAAAALRMLEIPEADLPVLLVPGSAILRNPTMVDLRDALGLADGPDGDDRCDLLVVGGGPGGLAAAVYGASEGLATILVEDTALGGQAGTSSRIENYLGFPAGLSGAELATRGVLQAEKFGARIRAGTQAVELGEIDDLHAVALDDGRRVLARAVIVATGARYRRLGLDGMEQLEGVGVYYAATGMEARACAGGPVVVVGGGNSAGQAALFLARACTQVEIVIRRAELAETMSRYLIDAIEREPRIVVVGGTEVTRLVAGPGLEAVDLTETASGAVRTAPVCGLFVFIGVAPNTRWLDGQLAQDGRGFILTGEDIPSADRHPLVPAPLAAETSRPGIFCVGDARSGSVKRVATAIGEGAAAVRLAFERFAATGGPES
ncbi:MAG: cyclic nucleotide-binding protein [Conexibacter sp.]|nr:cyclic nucleotide-binding protein [Conexibacter sp.]